MTRPPQILPFFFFNDTATTEIYTLSLHDALPIFLARPSRPGGYARGDFRSGPGLRRFASGRAVASMQSQEDRKSTRLNPSHQIISYAVFCLKKKKRLDLQLNNILFTHVVHITPVA